MLLEHMLGGDWSVSVCAKGGLVASVTEDASMYFGCSKCLGQALNTNADVYIIALGTNDVLQGNCTYTQGTTTDGLVRIVLQRLH